MFVLCLFFWKVIIKGLVTLPADITVGMYFPWLDYKWGYVVGVPVKNPLISDAISQFYPFKIYAIDQIKSGIIPLWNSSMFGGYPLLANIQIGIFNPTNLFYWLFSNTTAWSLQTISQPLLAMIFTFLFLRSLKIEKFAAIFGSIIYAFSGFNIIWMQLNIHSFSTACLPLIFYAAKKFLDTQKIIFGILISVAVGMQIFFGYPQIAIYSLLSLFFFVVFSAKFSKKCLLVFLFVFLGFCLSAIQLIPTAELFVNAQRQFEKVPFAQIYLPFKHIISFFAPDYFGNPVTGNYWGTGDYSTVSGYSGIVAIILAGIAVFNLRKDKNVFFLTILLIISLLLAFPTPFLKLFHTINFFGLGSSGSSRVLFLTNFCLACLAAVGLSSLSIKLEKKYFRAFYVPFVIVGGYLLGTILSILLIKYTAIQMDLIMMKNLSVGLKNLIAPSLLFVLILGIFLILYFVDNNCSKFSYKKIVHKLLVNLIIVAAIAELFRFGWKFTPFSKPDFVYPQTPVIDYVKKQEGIFRVEGGDAVPMNMLTPFGFETMSGYDPLYPLKNAQILALIDNETVNHPKSRFGKIEKYNSKLLDLSNICYVFSVKKDEIEKPSEIGNPAYQFRLKKFKTVFSDKSVNVLKNKDCLQRAFLARNIIIESNPKKIAGIITSEEFNPATTIVIEKPIDEKISLADGKGDKLRWVVSNPNTKKIQIIANSPALLFLSESYYPGWQAFIDGKETEILRADFVFRAVYVPAGEHEVIFKYQPKSFNLGWQISSATITGLALIIICAKIASFKNKKLII